MTTADPIAVLEAIVSEVAGAGQPFSADSYLPPHLIHDARQAIEAESKSAAEWKAREAHESLLLARLAKADEMIASLRAEIDALRKINASAAGPVRMALQEASESVLALRLQNADEAIASLRAEVASLRKSNSDLAKAAISGIEITDKERHEILGKYGHSPLVFDPAGRFIDQPPDTLFGQWKAASSPDDASRLMHMTVYARQECDA